VYDRGEGDFLQDSSAAFVLAGGNSTRMGTDKAFVTLDGKTLLARALEVARSLCEDVRIIGDAAKFAAFGPVVEDVFRGCGPLAGIHAALRASGAELNLMLAVDLPFVSRELLEFLIARARGSEALVTVARAGGRLQPLCGFDRREFGDVAELALRAGRYKIDALFEVGRTEVVEQKELEQAGFPASIFRNLNTREEVEAAGAEDKSDS
jgi:molybdopterin-guanine dinucleotide biosynthesis protein A